MSLFDRGERARLLQALDDVRRQVDLARADNARLCAAFDAVPAGLVLADVHGMPALRNRASTYPGHADVLVKEAVERLLVQAARGVAGEQRLSLFGPPQRVLLITAVPLAGGGSLATIDDLSERARLEGVRTDFVSNISHELKTPVGALALLAEALADSDEPEVHRRLSGKMVDEAHRAARTIDDLLALSQIELGGSDEPEQVDVVSIVGEAATRHRLTAEARGIALQVDPIGDLVVRGDRLQLASAISNLIENAVKYSDRGGVVRVSVHADDGWLAIDVVDQGIGIPVRDLDRIFERFYRVDRARSRDTGGTGLGLAIVRHVATNHGGDVAVVSREGEGSTFTLRIPMKETA